MTDITNQDRRVAHEWAASIDPEMDCWSASARAVARVILATVDAPAPTLSERLRYRAALLDNGDPDGDTLQALRDLAADAAQMERDLTEARAEAERLTADLAEAYKTRDARDDEVDRLRAEVERLTAVNENLRRTDNYREFKEFLGVQKAAESNAETPDPADVKPGEAWVVECRGERRAAVKDNDDTVPWCTVNADGWFNAEKNESVTLVSRLVPAPRVITKPDELDRMPEGTIIRDKAGDIMVRDSDGWTEVNSDEWVVSLPATVLWEPATP